MSLRAKFKVDAVIDYGSYDKVHPNKKVEMSAVYSHDKSKEDNQFSAATPSGQLNMMISNPAATDFFKPGVKYYFDIHECEDQS